MRTRAIGIDANEGDAVAQTATKVALAAKPGESPAHTAEGARQRDLRPL